MIKALGTRRPADIIVRDRPFYFTSDRDHSPQKKTRLTRSCGNDVTEQFISFYPRAAPNPFWVSMGSSAVYATLPPSFFAVSRGLVTAVLDRRFGGHDFSAVIAQHSQRDARVLAFSDQI